MNLKRLGLVVAGSVLALLVWPLPSAAQWTEGTIVGTVTDETGAAVAGARVEVVSQQTGHSREFRTDDTGIYRVPLLRPGRYEVRVEVPGFRQSVVTDVEVRVNVTTRADVQLELGAVEETIEVVAGVPLVQIEEARLGDTVGRRQVSELPLKGRDIFQLALLQPGVTATNAPVISNTSFNRFESAFVSHGASVRGNNFVLDGTNNNNEWLGGTPAITPSVEAVQEFQVQTLNFSAEYGRTSGSVMNIITRSGTNRLDGSLFWFHRNDAFDARNFFDEEKAPFLQHIAGVSAGGPIRRDQTFFFGNFEGVRSKRGITQLRFTETPEFRQQVAALRPDSLANMFFQDFPGPPCTPGSKVDRGSIPDPAAGAFAIGPRDGIPDSCIGRYVRPQRRTSNQYLIRLDHNFADTDRLSVRWLDDRRDADVSLEQLFTASARDFQADLTGDFADLNVSYNRIFAPTFLNDVRFSFNRSDFGIGFTIPPSRTRDMLASAGTPDFFGTLAFGDGTAQFGRALFVPREFRFNTFTVSNIATQIRGRHSLKYGVELRHVREASNYELETRPFYLFSSIFNFANDQPWLAEALINRNVNSPGFGDFVDTPRNFSWTNWALFVQDDWKVRSNLTLNLGLRYEVFGSPREKNGLLANIVPGPGANLLEQMRTARMDRVDRMYGTLTNNFSPRIGATWDPTGAGTTALRTGFAVAYLEPYSNLWSNASRFNPPDAAWMAVFPAFGVGTDVNYAFPFRPSPDFARPPSATQGVPGVQINPAGIQPDLRAAYSVQWFLGGQRALGRHYSVSANYIGTRGVGLYLREDWNRQRGDLADFVEDRLQSEWGQIWYVGNFAESIYHGGSFQLRRAPSRGIQFVANYTLGHLIDYPGSDPGLGDFTNVSAGASLYTGAQDIADRRADRGPGDFDVRHRFTFNAIWDVPGPRDDTLLGAVLGGWQVNTIVSLQTGRPFTVLCTHFWFDGCDWNLDGTRNDRPNDPGLPRSGYDRQDFVSGVFTVQDFCPDGLVPFFAGTPCVPAGQNGNLGRNAFRGQGYATVDLSLFKNVPFSGRYNMQFRWEVFNVLNRPNLFNPIGDLASPLFGKSTFAFPGREMQFGLKLTF